MDEKTTVAQIKKWFTKTYEDRNWNPSLKSMAISLSLEANELLEHFQWNDDEKVLKKRGEREEIESELGDVFNYLCKFADKMGLDLSRAAKKTVLKINKKYPAEKIKASPHGEFYEKQKKKYRVKKK